METLAATAISLVAPYLAKGAEEFAKEAFATVKALATRLSAWWSSKPVAAAAAQSLAENPETYGKLLGDLLQADLAKDPALEANLRELVDTAGPSVEVVQKMEIARGVTGARIGEMVGGKVHVQQEMKDAQNVEGVIINKLGG